MTAFQIMKLALTDLIMVWGEQGDFIVHMMDLDKGIQISPNRVAASLRNADSYPAQFIGKNMDVFGLNGLLWMTK